VSGTAPSPTIASYARSMIEIDALRLNVLIATSPTSPTTRLSNGAARVAML